RGITILTQVSMISEREATAMAGAPLRGCTLAIRERGAIVRAVGHLGLGTGSLTGALLLAELLIRLIAPQQLVLVRPDVWEPVDTVGWMFRPNLNTTV